MALLVGAEVAPQDAGALLVVHPPDAQQVGVVAQPEQRPGLLGRPVGLLHPQPHQHLGRGAHVEETAHQVALALRLEDEHRALLEDALEEGQVQRRLFVRRRVHDGPLAHQRQPADGGVVQVGVEGDDLGAAALHRLEQGGRLRALQIDPMLHVVHPCRLGIGQQPPRQRVEPLAPPGL